MAECCDVMVAHSPPALFSTHNPPPELSVLYQNFRLVMTQKQQSPLSVRRYNNNSNNSSNNARSSGSPTRENNRLAGGGGGSAKPTRPCLVIRTDSEGSIGSTSSGSSSDENEPPSPTRRKKKVVFADDRGLSLTQVRLMNEPSNQPPKLMTVSPYLNQQSAAAASTGVGSVAARQLQEQQQLLWQVRFSQPASCYLDFRKRLDTGNISLENVIVKSPDSRILGTVKVRNLSYDKEVFVRSTDNKWVTYRDTLCTYVQNNGLANNGSCPAPSGPMQNGVTAIYDTFSFRLSLPADATSMEFAVCYKSPEFECWDNNDGSNYCLSVGSGQSATGQQPMQLQNSVSSSSGGHGGLGMDYEHHQKQPVHYFGAQSRQNPWTTWRDPKNDTSAYW